MAGERGRAAAIIREAIVESNGGSPASFAAWQEKARVGLRLAFGEGDQMLVRFDEIKYTPSFWSDRTPQSYFDEVRAGGVTRAVALLEAALLEVEAAPDESSPPVDIGGLHPWVAGMASTLWASGHHRQAVEEAARAIEVQLKAKLNIVDGTAVGVASEAFSAKNPTPERGRLRFAEFEEGSESWTNAHDGAGNFSRGCFQRIRNLLTHGHEIDDQEALESLAALSLLARWIDRAEVEWVPTDL